jgi:hypothetical protein
MFGIKHFLILINSDHPQNIVGHMLKKQMIYVNKC